MRTSVADLSLTLVVFAHSISAIDNATAATEPLQLWSGLHPQYYQESKNLSRHKYMAKGCHYAPVYYPCADNHIDWCCNRQFWCIPNKGDEWIPPKPRYPRYGVDYQQPTRRPEPNLHECRAYGFNVVPVCCYKDIFIPEDRPMSRAEREQLEYEQRDQDREDRWRDDGDGNEEDAPETEEEALLSSAHFVPGAVAFLLFMLMVFMAAVGYVKWLRGQSTASPPSLLA